MKRFLLKGVWVVGALGLALVLPAVVWAQQPPSAFIPAEEMAAKPELSPAPLLYGAYAFVWIVLLVYVFVLWRRIGRVEGELRDVNRKLTARPR